MNTPVVTVLMPVYNGEEHLREAIESILAQTFTDFEFLIIDDGSTDSTPDILKEYARQDSRIHLERNEQNLKIAATLNKGLAMAAALLIARMDADDVAAPYRLEKQVAFMQANPDVTVCGSALSLYYTPEDSWLPPTGHEAIRAQLLFESCLYHPTVMYKKDQVCLYAGGYDTSLPLAQDYDLWARLSMNPVVRFANLPETLCRYRIGGKDKKYSEFQQSKANLVREKLLSNIGLTPSEEEFAAHLALSLWKRTLSFSDIWACKKWLSKLYVAAINAEPAYERETLKNELQYRWLVLCMNNITASAFGLIYFCSEFRQFSIKLVLRFAKWSIKNILVDSK